MSNFDLNWSLDLSAIPKSEDSENSNFSVLGQIEVNEKDDYIESLEMMDELAQKKKIEPKVNLNRDLLTHGKRQESSGISKIGITLVKRIRARKIFKAKKKKTTEKFFSPPKNKDEFYCVNETKY